MAFPRYRVVFAAAAAGLAIFFSTAGLYGLMSASLLQRRREMGIRLAVGATRRDISMIFIWQAIRWTAPAALLGTLCAAALVFAYGSFIEGISPNYIPAYVGSLVGLGLTAALATLLPVRRALQSDVMTSLRYD